MPNCTMIFHRHAEVHNRRITPSGFVAEKLAPLVEEAKSSGSILRVIHDRVPTLSVTPELMSNFERYATFPGIRKKWRKLEKRWHRRVRANFLSADQGRQSEDFEPGLGPEFALILEANRRSPRTVVNYLGAYPFEAVIERIRYDVYESRAKEYSHHQYGLREAVKSLIASQQAMASSMLLRAEQVMEKVRSVPSDVVLLEGYEHLYLEQLFLERGLEVTVEIEPGVITFGQQALNSLANGGLGTEEHRRLALLHMMLIGYMNSNDLWDAPDEWDAAYHKVLQDYEELSREVFGPETKGSK